MFQHAYAGLRQYKRAFWDTNVTGMKIFVFIQSEVTTPRKINMEPENHSVLTENSHPKVHSQVPC